MAQCGWSRIESAAEDTLSQKLGTKCGAVCRA
jgi:hypothetical protein